MRAVAAGIGMELLAFDAAGPDDYPSAFAAMRAAGVQALAITSSPTFNRDAGLLARLALEMGMPMLGRVGRQRAIRGTVPIRGPFGHSNPASCKKKKVLSVKQPSISGTYLCEPISHRYT